MGPMSSFSRRHVGLTVYHICLSWGRGSDYPGASMSTKACPDLPSLARDPGHPAAGPHGTCSQPRTTQQQRWPHGLGLIMAGTFSLLCRFVK